MSQRDDYEPGVPCWVDTLQPDPEAAMAFYGALFGWEFAGPGPMGLLAWRGCAAATSPGSARRRPTARRRQPAWTTYVYVRAPRRPLSGPQRGRRRPRRGLRRARPPVAWPSSPTRRAPRSAHGSPASARARSSSTSPERGR